MASASCREKPDWVSAQAIPVAVPMISRMAPDSAAVSTSAGQSFLKSSCPIDEGAGEERIGDPDRRNFGRGCDAFDDGGADDEGKRQRRKCDQERA